MPMDSLLANKAFDTETTRLLGSAFDAAWERVEASDGLLTDRKQMALIREQLAKFIIVRVEQGEKDRNRLIESALLRLRIILRHDAGSGEASNPKTNEAQDEQNVCDPLPNAEVRRAR